jgi:hypothetical protein
MAIQMARKIKKRIEYIKFVSGKARDDINGRIKIRISNVIGIML